MGKRRRRSNPDAWWKIEVGGMPVWGILGALALVAVMAVGTVVSLPEQSTADPNRTTRPVPSFLYDSDSAAATEPVAVSVIGDSFTGGSGMDSGATSRWPALLAGSYAITTFHEGGTGYAATLDTAAGPSNFVTRVEQMPADGIERVAFFGSINDGREGYDATREAASAAFNEARAKWPEASIVAIGPASPRWPVPAEFTTARDATRDAAAEAGVTFIDPIDLRWFEGTTGLIGADNTHPTDAGHEYLSQRLAEVLATAF